MANESQYYNPIIQAMVASAQKQQQQAELAQQAAQFKQQQQLREQQLSLEETKATHEHEHQTGLLDIAKKHGEAQLELNRLERIKLARDLATSGIDVGQAVGSLGGQAPSGIPDSQKLLQAEANRVKTMAGAQAGGVAEAEIPFKLQEEKVKSENRLKELQLHTASAERIAKLQADRMESVARLNGAYHLKGIAMMHQLGEGSQSEQAQQLADGIFNGNVDWKSLSTDQKRAASAYLTGTGELNSVPTDNKAYTKKLDALSSLQTIMDQYRDLAVNFSRDSPGAMAKGNQNITLPIVGTWQRTVPGSDLESKLNSMKASGGQLATYFDQQNRKSDAEILRQVLGSFDPRATAKQNVQKLEQHIQQLQQAVKNTFTGMSPERIDKILQDRNITDFGLGLKGGGGAEGGESEYVRGADGKLVKK